MSDVRALLAALQYGDSAYPAGGFAQSWGLETAVAEGAVHDAATLAAACRAYLCHQVAPTDAVATAACAAATAARDLDRFIAVDRRLSATRPAREPRTGAQRLGRRLLETAATAERDPWLERLRTEVRAGHTPGNHASVLGAVAGLLELSAEQAAGLALWSAASGFLNAALRLLRVTHDDVQAIQVALRPRIADLAMTAARAEPLRMAGSSPQLEIWAMRHEVATVRLFAS